jgi:hypothetical protein
MLDSTQPYHLVPTPTFVCLNGMLRLICDAWLQCIVGHSSKMVCMPRHVKMVSMLKLVMMENHTATGKCTQYFSSFCVSI